MNAMESPHCSPHRCVILAAGDYYNEPIEIPDDSLVIAADGGLDHAKACEIAVDYVVGDFDSVTHRSALAGMPNTIVLPKEKDDPDLLSALKLGWHQGAREFDVYGALGGRIDHTISALQCTAMIAVHGAMMFLHGQGTMVTAITDGRLDFPAHHPVANYMVSVFAHSDTASGINEPGMKYQLNNAVMTNTAVNGVSNEFIDGVPASIDIHDGTLIVTYPIGTPRPTWHHYRELSGSIGEVCTEVSSVLNSRALRKE